MAIHVVNEARRCLHCKKPMCREGCPISTNIPEAIELFRTGHKEEAGEMLYENNPLSVICSLVCDHEKQCEGHCVLGRKGAPVHFSSIENYISDAYLDHLEPEMEPKKGQRVAIIGSGPAGITISVLLARRGYDVTIFEKLTYAGGILTYGIPQFVLPNSVVDREIETLKARGVEIVTGTPIDKDKSVDDLFAAGYEAIFVGNGADVPQPPRGLDTSLTGVWSANDYLTQVNLHNDTLPANIKDAKRVLVVGGGNVAVDAVRCARRLGAETIMVYRRTIAEAPARRDEIAHTYEEDIEIRELTNPVSCYSKDGVLTGVKCEKMVLGEPDESGRRRPVGTGEYFDVDCDNLVIATGTSYSDAVVDTTTGIDKDKWGGIATDASGKTSRPGVFAGGDAVTGPQTVVKAMGAGKQAAVSIDAYLSGR